MDDIAYLIKEEVIGKDTDGNEVTKRTPRMVFCRVRSITGTEYYNAATDNLRPEIVITISHRIDYEDEKLVRWHGKYYDLIRTYWSGDGVELTLSHSVGIQEGEDESWTS